MIPNHKIQTCQNIDVSDVKEDVEQMFISVFATLRDSLHLILTPNLAVCGIHSHKVWSRTCRSPYANTK